MADLDEDVDFLFDEQIIQDERLFSLEQISIDVDEQLDIIDGTLEGNKIHQITQRECRKNFWCIIIAGLQATTLALDLRVTVLEENGGSDGNTSVAELEVRVEILEGTADDHETRLSATESDVTGRYSSEALCFK